MNTPTSQTAEGANAPFNLVLIGTSLGGLHALEILLSGFPKDFPLPVAIAQHRHKDSDETLITFLQRWCILPLKEAEDKEAIMPGRVYLAPPDYHLLVETESHSNDWQQKTGCPMPRFSLSSDPPVCYARPSINVLFESAADACGERAIGVILTGASADGARGLVSIKARGGLAVVQDPTTAESATMPRAARAAVSTAKILALENIAPFLTHLCCSSLTS
ncbi:chemotaxis protein CheB [Coleofasciculus sp. LEGE 07081]|uniref:chemotaxis protein CheB n=1 Tax=unclassified Coleofasciculus TaxID=2692782 RepID=UPI001880C427|nr:chemotaxis protein CheB [Coleofasciculus sp. LEGE 07081]MBE9147289.1 chemotaxis protein CheB [Coleofasciculus sp. LEGE 07092]